MKSDKEKKDIIEQYLKHLHQKEFPCIAAHEAATKQTIKCYVAENMRSSDEDHMILDFLYGFVDYFRNTSQGYHSSAVIFSTPLEMNEEEFDYFLWQRLQGLSDLDAQNYGYDPRVQSNTSSPHFSFSLKEEAFYIIGVHAGSHRRARQFEFPTLVFNPHAQFEKLREEKHFIKMQQIVRKRDVAYSGSVNPMLSDFGNEPEVYQYSGRQYDKAWKCPLNIKHGDTEDHSTP